MMVGLVKSILDKMWD